MKPDDKNIHEEKKKKEEQEEYIDLYWQQPSIGWICPVCGRGLSPWSTFCPCQVEGVK
jgi:uncharacterized OB-fold protein